MKEKIYRLIKKIPLIMRIYIKKYNRFPRKTNAVNMSGIKIRHNQVILNGKNHVFCGIDCSIQNNKFVIHGNENRVEIRDNVEINGSDQQTIFMQGNNNHIIIESGCRISNTSFFIVGSNNKITISKNVSTMATEFHIERDNNTIFIGENTSMHGRGTKTVHFALDEGTNVVVGEDCMFSNDIQIRSSDSHSILDLGGKRLNQADDIVIGKHCWLGLRCMLLKGTEIPDYTVVAGGATCTKKYTESNTIIAGVPAKVVKRDINWDRERFSVNVK